MFKLESVDIKYGYGRSQQSAFGKQIPTEAGVFADYIEAAFNEHQILPTDIDDSQLLTRSRLLGKLTTFFSNNTQTLESTLGALGVSDIDGLTTTQLQVGLKAYILLHQAWQKRRMGPPKRVGSFITYLSKGAEGTYLGDEAHNDFAALKALHQRHTSLFSEKFCAKFQIVNPFTEFSVPIGDTQFPAFTMPFMPYGELHLRTVFAGSLMSGYIPIPYLGYAVDFTKDIKRVEHTQEKHALIIRRGMAQPTEETVLAAHQSQHVLTRQFHDLIRFYISIWEAADHHIINEFQICAGDVLGIVDRKGIKKGSICTIRGGFSETPVTQDELYQIVARHAELNLHENPLSRAYGRYIYPFETLEQDTFENLVADVRKNMK